MQHVNTTLHKVVILQRWKSNAAGTLLLPKGQLCEVMCSQYCRVSLYEANIGA